jgi:hypothetical protein
MSEPWSWQTCDVCGEYDLHKNLEMRLTFPKRDGLYVVKRGVRVPMTEAPWKLLCSFCLRELPEITKDVKALDNGPRTMIP